MVLSRNRLLEVLHTATVALISSTRRGAPTEIALGVAEGLKVESAANLANVFTVEQSALRLYVGSVSAAKMRTVCHALAIAFACDEP